MVAPGVPKDCGASHRPPLKVKAWPVLSTTAQVVGDGQDTAAVRDSGWPGPGSVGLAGSAGAPANGAGVDQVVPLPSLTWSDPSTITQVGPEVQTMEGSIGALTGPLGGAG